MDDDADPILEVVAALLGAGVVVVPSAEELDSWQIGDLTFTDAELWRLAASRGLVKDGDS